MWISTPILALTQLVASVLNAQSYAALSSSSSVSTSSSYPSAHLDWIGDLPSWPENSGASVSACTFALGPPGPPASALCPAFTAFCTAFRDDMRSRRIATLKTNPIFSPPPRSSDNDDEHDPLINVKFRTGCTGGSTFASDGSYVSAYTATCIVDGVDWIPYVFSQFLRAEFAEKGNEDGPLPIYSSFVGCQVPARL